VLAADAKKVGIASKDTRLISQAFILDWEAGL